MVTVLNGLVGGLVATIVMTAVMMAVGDDSPPPTALLWTEYISDGAPEDAQMPGMLLHLVYGTIAGGVFVYLSTILGFIAVGTLTGAVLWAIVYGIILFVIGTVFWLLIILGQDVDRQMAVMFLVLHLIYAIVLGLWIQLGPTL